MTHPLTKRQEQVLLLVQRGIAATGRAPTYAVLCQSTGIVSRGAMCDAVNELCERGYLERVMSGGKAMGLRVLKQIPDDRFADAARAVCQALGVVTPDNIAVARAEIAKVLLPEAA